MLYLPGTDKISVLGNNFVVPLAFFGVKSYIVVYFQFEDLSGYLCA